MKLYDPKSLPRLVFLTIALILTSVYLAIIPKPTYIPQTADPQELYHVVWEVTGQTFFDTGKLEDWSKWEHKFDGKLKSQEDAQKAIDEMLASLGDNYTFYQGVQATTAENKSREGTFVGIGVAFGAKIENNLPVKNPAGEVLPEQSNDKLPLVKQVLEGSPAAKAGIHDGDAIVSVNGKSAADVSMKVLVGMIKGETGTPVTIVVRRGAQDLTFTIKRDAVVTKSVNYKRLDNKIGLITITHFGADNMLSQLADALRNLKDCRGLIIDLRNNPGGQVGNAVFGAAMFLKTGTIVHEKTRGNDRITEVQIAVVGNRLAVASVENGKPSFDTGLRPVRFLSGQPLVILVNGYSASASEMFTGALQDNGRAVVVGTKSYGKGIGQSVIPMPNGTALHVTSLRYYTPSHRWVGDGTGAGLFAMGINPDVVVEADKSGDNQLAAAVTAVEKLIKNAN